MGRDLVKGKGCAFSRCVGSHHFEAEAYRILDNARELTENNRNPLYLALRSAFQGYVNYVLRNGKLMHGVARVTLSPSRLADLNRGKVAAVHGNYSMLRHDSQPRCQRVRLAFAW
jgi:hypothetical protein